ncbi:MAG: thiamine diphosphokinase [Clostridia bacterium]|nr:thiamine diphosphokinase [Clostridia bacterium]
MRCIIIAPLYQGEERAWVTPTGNDLVICADAGYRQALAYGIAPQLIIGDFDSLGYVPEGNEVIRLPVAKDDTDMVVCLNEGRKRGYREFIVAGALGGRFDHTLACLQCVADGAARGERIWLCDGQNRVTVLAPGQHTIPRLSGRKLSLLAFTPEVKGVTLTGTVWTLEDAVLTSRYPLGCSNEWTADEADLTFTEGLLVLCISGDPEKDEHSRSRR